MLSSLRLEEMGFLAGAQGEAGLYFWKGANKEAEVTMSVYPGGNPQGRGEAQRREFGKERRGGIVFENIS